MTKTIGIIGHGFVGRAMERLFSLGFETAVYDIVSQPDRSKLANVDIAFVCVPTPMTPDGSVDTSIVEDVVSWLEAPLICIKSTVPPGTTDRLREQYGKPVNFSPEFIVERTMHLEMQKPDSFVIAGGDEASEVLDYFQAVMPVTSKYWAVSAIEAELTKYMANSYFAAKVTFCNEFARIAGTFGVDYKRLRELWTLDPRIEADHTAVFPDKPGYGGKCLPKDIAGIIATSSRAGYEPEFLKAVCESNNRFINQKEH